MNDVKDTPWVQKKVNEFKTEMQKVLVGQDNLVEGLLVALICGQHVLIEGVPGLAKTLTVKTLAKTLGLDFQRIQFTPDLLPSDLLGTQIFHPQKGDFAVKKGPIFTSILLADEINRAPAKVQSALLEAMEERQVTLGEETFPLPRPFLVLATQNPIEQEGTYSLPEAQLDRFMMKIHVDYPTRAEELAILRQKKTKALEPVQVFTLEDLDHLQFLAGEVHVDPLLEEFIVDLVRTSRDPKSLGLDNYLRWGAGPRAVYFLLWAARAKALIEGRNFVLPEDLKHLAPGILRHRILLSYEALAEGKTPDDLVQSLLLGVPAP